MHNQFALTTGGTSKNKFNSCSIQVKFVCNLQRSNQVQDIQKEERMNTSEDTCCCPNNRLFCATRNIQ